MPKSKAAYDAPRYLHNNIKGTFEEDMKNYNVLYVFSFKDIKSRFLHERFESEQWSDSKMVFGMNKVVIGTLQNLISKHSHWPDLENLLKLIKGRMGVLLTNRPQWEILEWFNTFSIWDYPQPGFEVTETIKLESGPLPLFRPEMEPYLRHLGMRTTLVDGVVFLKKPFLICKAGAILSKRQVSLLELLGEKLSVYQLQLEAIWTKGGGLEVLTDNDFEKKS